MQKVISIYNAKTNLSKLVKRAQNGETIYVGAYGQAQAVLSPLPIKKHVQIGIWAHHKLAHENYDDLIGSDPDIVKDFEDSINNVDPELWGDV